SQRRCTATGRLPPRRTFLRQLPAPARRTLARGGSVFPRADPAGQHRWPAPHRRTGARAHRRRDGMSTGPYQAPWWLRSGHVQTLLGSSPWRQRHGARALAATGAVTRMYLVDGGDGVRLQGLHSVLPGVQPHGLALLMHGWEGSAESGYMRLAAA